MTLCTFRAVGDMAVCERCGFSMRRRHYDLSRIRSPCVMPRTEEQIAELVAICAACEYWRDHPTVGGRCTHKRCGCGRGTEAVMVGEIRINAGLVDRMRRGAACPIGAWAQKESPLAGEAAG